MDTQNYQKKSPRSSTKSKQDTSGSPESAKPYRTPIVEVDENDYLDRSIDQVARVRAAKEAAQREMESFGDLSEYDVTILQGQLTEPPSAQQQPIVDFETGTKETN